MAIQEPTAIRPWWQRGHLKGVTVDPQAGCSQVTELGSGSQTGVHPGALLPFGLFCTLSLPQPWRLQKQQSEGMVNKGQEEMWQGAVKGQFLPSPTLISSSAGLGPEGTAVGPQKGEELWKQSRGLIRT